MCKCWRGCGSQCSTSEAKKRMDDDQATHPSASASRCWRRLLIFNRLAIYWEQPTHALFDAEILTAAVGANHKEAVCFNFRIAVPHDLKGSNSTPYLHTAQNMSTGWDRQRIRHGSANEDHWRCMAKASKVCLQAYFAHPEACTNFGKLHCVADQRWYQA